MELRYTFDPERFYLGTLCKHEHRWPGTDLSLRRIYKSPGGITVNHCVACTGRKQSNWLISFIDVKAMGLPEGLNFGKPCKGGHLWNGHEMTLRDSRNKCSECEKKRKSSPEALAKQKAWREKNQEEERRKARERQVLRMQDPEQRRIHSERQARHRAIHGRQSRAKGIDGLMLPPGRALSIPEAAVARWLVRSGCEISWPVLEPMIAAHLQIQDSLRAVGHCPTVADLVEAERRRYLREHPEIRREADRIRSREQHRLRYLTDPDYRLYHRQKSKRRKAQMRDSVAIQLSGKQVRARFAQFDHRCAYCGAEGELHIEHVVPISKGGTHALGNVVPACESCNYSKTTHEVESWYRSQPFFSETRWRKIRRVLNWDRSAVGQLALL
jgi:5-methylcytosine-specific restriction endonuclease McrA